MFLTDDRGVYRVFGIPAGSYVVLADGINFGWSWMNADYEENIPTYYPSSTRDTALEVTINHGDELSGIDIRYRSELGRRVSGKLTGAIESRNNLSVSVRYPASGNAVATTYVYDHKQGVAFELRGVPNGEYDLIAESKLGLDAGAAAAPRRVIVAGVDVMGVELKLMPLATLNGRVVLEELKASERPPTCEIKRNAIIEETVVTARFDEERRVQPQTTVPSAQGEFKLNNLDPGRYRLNFDLPSEDWYIRAMTLPADATTKKPMDAARSGITLRSGETGKPVTVMLSKGAAGLIGTVSTSQPTRVFLVPVEKEFADDVLRYAEAISERDGAFVFKHLAPGKYWVFARQLRESNRPVALDNTTRVELRQAAEATNQTIQLQPCQRVTDYKLNLPAR